MLPAMAHGSHPVYLVLLLLVLLVLGAGAFVLGWAFRTGWNAAGPPGPPAQGP